LKSTAAVVASRGAALTIEQLDLGEPAPGEIAVRIVADVRRGRSSRDGIEPGAGGDQRRRAVRRVTVRPGDVVRGDASGLVVIPREHLAPVLDMTKAVADRETGWRQAIARGASLPAATGIDDLISKLAADRAIARR
jgi:hypothetical protein